MKTIPGKIIIGIDNKVYFEPDELPKPSKAIYNRAKLYHFENLIIQKYEASKQLIEVENELKNKSDYKMFENMDYLIQINDVYYFKQHHKIDGSNYLIVKNNQNCKAEIKGEKATIIELNK